MKDYFSNIGIINEFLEKQLEKTIIIPVLTNDIAFKENKENSDYCNFAYMSGKDYYSNFINTSGNDNIKYKKKLKEDTDKKNKEFAKSKLKHSIIKNMSYNNDIKTRQYAEYYYNTITNNEEDDKIVYYLDFVNEYNLLTNVIDFALKEEPDSKKIDEFKKVENIVYEFKKEISKHNNNKDLLKQANTTYLGPSIFMNYNLIDILILCGIIILTILLYSIKHIINIYITGIILLMIMICIVFLTVIFI
jgi:hypothetical protein